MKCTKCGNISRFEVYRLELKKLILGSYSGVPKRIYQRVVETGPVITIVCIKCSAKGPPIDFSYSEEDKLRVGSESIVKTTPPLDEIRVQVTL